MIVIVADGQSNNAYRSNETLPESHQITSQNHIWDQFNNVWRTGPEAANFPSPNPEIQPAPLFTGSIAMSLAQRIVDETGQDTYTIHNVWSGREINGWVANGESSSLFVALKDKVLASAVSKVHVHLWLQGERDGVLGTSEADYITRFTQYRTQLQNQSWWANGPMCLMGLVPGAITDDMNPALLSIANANDRISFVDGAGIQVDDLVHYRDEGQWEMGYNRFWMGLQQAWTNKKSFFHRVLL